MNIIKCNTLVVGKNSSLATEYRKYLNFSNKINNYNFIHHTEITNKNNFNNVQCIINFAINPKYALNSYNESLDFDLKVARIAKKYGIHYIFISTRAVYANHVSLGAKEDSPLKKNDECKQDNNFYAYNKLKTEFILKEMLGVNLTILRLANIISYEYNRIRFKETFISTLLQRLKMTNKIVLDFSGSTRKDFITDTFFSQALEKIAKNPPGIVLNMGSGIAVPVENIVSWIALGFGKKVDFIVKTDKVIDEFFLNTTRLENLLKIKFNITELKEKCISIGRELVNE